MIKARVIKHTVLHCIQFNLDFTEFLLTFLVLYRYTKTQNHSEELKKHGG